MLHSFFYPICYRWNGKKFVKFQKRFNPLDEIFLWHENVIRNKFQYMYLSDDGFDAIIAGSNNQLFHQRNLRSLTYQELNNKLNNDANQSSFDMNWDFVIPWEKDTMIGCFDGYKLVGINTKNNELMNEIIYYPGVSIINCTFRNIDADDETYKFIRFNGGIE